MSNENENGKKTLDNNIEVIEKAATSFLDKLKNLACEVLGEVVETVQRDQASKAATGAPPPTPTGTEPSAGVTPKANLRAVR